MLRIHATLAIPLSLLGCVSAMPAAAETPFSFSTGNPDGLMATATRPDSPGKFEIESADDFVITHSTSITSATFTGLVPAGATVSQVVVEVYRVFPNDSDVNRTSGQPTFSTSKPRNAKAVDRIRLRMSSGEVTRAEVADPPVRCPCVGVGRVARFRSVSKADLRRSQRPSVSFMTGSPSRQKPSDRNVGDRAAPVPELSGFRRGQ